MKNWTPSRRLVVIVGGGFGGTVAAIKLLDRTGESFDLTIVEPREQLGRGVAYSTKERVHLVNAPARVFSLHPEDPDHFSRWLERNAGDFPTEPGGYAETCAPRWLYGTYVGEELARAVADAAGRSTLRHAQGRAASIERAGLRSIVVLEDGERLEADEVLLALGVFKGRPRANESDVAAHPCFVENPWNPEALDRMASAGDILLIGTSLSMVDVVASLESRGFSGRYQAISRRGHLVPRRGEPPERGDFLEGRPLPATALDLLRLVKAERRSIEAEGADWRSLLLALRPRIAPLWQGASTQERLRFARHLRSLWDVTLHQAASASRIWLERAREQGRFSSDAGRLLGLSPDGGRIAARIRWRADGREEISGYDAVIDCRGHQEHDWRRIDDPFVRRLLDSGLVRAHATGYGIDATLDGEVIDRDGKTVPGLHALGHPLRGVAWESSSIPEQLAQAIALADRLTGERATPVAAE